MKPVRCNASVWPEIFGEFHERLAHFFVCEEIRQAPAALDLFDKIRVLSFHGAPCMQMHAVAPTLDQKTLSIRSEFPKVRIRNDYNRKCYCAARCSACATIRLTSLLGIAKPISTLPAAASLWLGAEERRVDADDVAVEIYKRPSRISRVDRRIGLQKAARIAAALAAGRSR